MLDLAAGLYLRRQVRGILAGMDRAERRAGAVQEEVLAGLLAAAAGTEWGRRWDYRAIGDYETYRRRVPLQDYASLAPLWDRAAGGERDLAWPGQVRYFAMSSGTTAGNKYLPVSDQALDSNRRAGLVVLAACGLLARPPGIEVRRRGFFYLGGSAALRRRGACLEGDASGIMLRETPRAALRYRLPEPEVAAIPDWTARLEAIVARYLRAPVQALSACPVWAVALFRRMLEVSGERSVAGLWPDLRVIVTYGMNPAPYRPVLEAMAGRELRFVDTYSSSEGGMNAVQFGSGPELRPLLDNGVFFELIPLAETAAAEPRRLCLAEARAGEVYELALSTNGGVWAFRLGDLLRVASLDPPRVVFAGRTGTMLSAFGEHVTEEELVRAARAGAEAAGAEVAEFAVAPVFPDASGGHPRHDWLVEFRSRPADPAAFLRALDARLAAGNDDYADHRRADLDPPRLVDLAPGTLAEWLRRRGRQGGQAKVPRAIPGAADRAELEAVSGELAARAGARERQ